MKIQLPNGQKIDLDENVDLQEKIFLVNHLSNDWMPIIILNWNSNSVKYFIDTLANYLVWHKDKEEQGREDKEILSRGKLEKMNKFKKRSKTVNFSDLSQDYHEVLFGERGAE